MANKKLTAEEKIKVVRYYYHHGDSIRTIAARYGCSYGNVHRVLTEAGVTFRKRGGSHR